MKVATPGKTLMAGESVEVPHPFVRAKWLYQEGFGDFADDNDGWSPGIRKGPASAAGRDLIADGVGFQILTVVSRHKPGKFPERIFYTRRWRDPDKKEFGKESLHVRSVGAFTVLCRGYRHRFRMNEDRIQLVTLESEHGK